MDGPAFLLPTAGVARGNLKREKEQKTAVGGSVVKRKRLTDITNTVSSERPKDGFFAGANDYIAKLLEENTALLKVLGERNKIIEVSNVELQKLRFTLQKANQQNRQLAQANAQMLAELNFSKERLKALQHELGCTAAILRLKTSELDEKDKLNKQLLENIRAKEELSKCLDSVAEAFQAHPVTDNMACDPEKSPMLTDQTLSSSISTHHVSANKEDGRVRSLRRRSSNLNSVQCESKDFFDIKDGEFPAVSLISEPLFEDNPVELGTLATSRSNACTEQGKDEKKDTRRRSKKIIESFHVVNPIQHDCAAASSSAVSTEQGKEEEKQDTRRRSRRITESLYVANPLQQDSITASSSNAFIEQGKQEKNEQGKEEEEKKDTRRRSRRITESLHVLKPAQQDSSAASRSNTFTEQGKVEEKKCMGRKNRRISESLLVANNSQQDSSAASSSNAFTEQGKEEQQKDQSKKRSKRISECVIEEKPVQLDPSVASLSNAPSQQGKKEEQKDAFTKEEKKEQKDQSASSLSHLDRESQSISVGRPMRKAAEKVSSYKEIPLNVKMRRSEQVPGVHRND